MSEQTANISKIDEERRLVFGWANVAVRKDGNVVIDSQDDYIPPDELEAAAYEFNLTFRATGERHVGTAKGRLVESFMVTPEKLEKMGLAPDALPIGWWVGFKIDDDRAWEGVKKGEYNMFSIQGSGLREED